MSNIADETSNWLLSVLMMNYKLKKVLFFALVLSNPYAKSCLDFIHQGPARAPRALGSAY